MPAKILLVGATSAIAQPVARHFASRGASLYLTGRRTEELALIHADLDVRGAAQTATEQLDVLDNAAIQGLVDRASTALGGLDTVIFAAGRLPNQQQLNAQPALLANVFQVNAVSAMMVLSEAANVFERQGSGMLVAVGSVAGDRGRAVNAAYGAAKGALEIFLSGLRQRLSRRGVAVLLIKPGFVDTPMTVDFAKGPLWASPEQVAHDIVRAMEARRVIVYTPWYWRWIMRVIRLIPERIFSQLKF